MPEMGREVTPDLRFNILYQAGYGGTLFLAKHQRSYFQAYIHTLNHSLMLATQPASLIPTSRSGNTILFTREWLQYFAHICLEVLSLVHYREMQHSIEGRKHRSELTNQASKPALPSGKGLHASETDISFELQHFYVWTRPGAYPSCS